MLCACYQPNLAASLEAVTAFTLDISVLCDTAFDLCMCTVGLPVRGALSQYTGMPCGSLY